MNKWTRKDDLEFATMLAELSTPGVRFMAALMLAFQDRAEGKLPDAAAGDFAALVEAQDLEGLRAWLTSWGYLAGGGEFGPVARAGLPSQRADVKAE